MILSGKFESNYFRKMLLTLIYSYTPLHPPPLPPDTFWQQNWLWRPVIQPTNPDSQKKSSKIPEILQIRKVVWRQIKETAVSAIRHKTSHVTHPPPATNTKSAK